MEEIEGRTITSSCPKAQGYVNLQNKMYEKAGKVVNRQQLKNFWDHCRRRFQTWTWLESMATGLGRDPYTGSIQASSDWWQQMEGLRRGARAFRNAPLRFIAKHHAVYEEKTVLLNCSGVAGSRPAQAQVPQEAEILDVEDLTHLALVMPSPEPSSEQRRGKGKRIMTPGSASGGSSKRTRSDSTGDALNRLADLRVQSNESRARREELRQAKSARACMELLKADGIIRKDPLYHMALKLFRDGYLREFFIDDCITAEERVYFIHSHYQPENTYAPPPTCSGGANGFGGWFGGGGGFGPGGSDGAAMY